MPRLPPSLLHHAHRLHHLLPLLLRPCRDLQSARNELRWLREHAINLSYRGKDGQKTFDSRWKRQLSQLCRERERGKPLQYILGSQPFGDLEILCKPGVLIPRPETENIVSLFATLLPEVVGRNGNSFRQRLRILDLCTGTGCIPYLFHSHLSPLTPFLKICGVDISSAAQRLALRNLNHNINLGHLDPIAREQITIVQDDIFQERQSPWRNSRWDVVVSNPPYISPNSYNKTTTRSVRNYEPKPALVPPQPQNRMPSNNPVDDNAIGDLFYPRLLRIARTAGAKIVLMEVMDMAQAVRVSGMVVESGVWDSCEIWRDWPAEDRDGGRRGEGERVDVGGQEVRIRGEGHGRGVLAWRKSGRWLGDRT